MPFTFAHPAIVLPLKRVKPKWFSLSGLVAGSMAPDFEYFFKFHATSTISETLAGIFTFNLPVAVGISLLFHQVLRNPLIKHLPHPYDRRFSGFLYFNFLQYLTQHPLRFISSALLGIVSHLLLDLLTSPDAMTRSFHKLQSSDLSQQILELQARLGAQPFIILERSLSVIGLVFIGWVLSKVNFPAEHFPKQHPQQKRRFYMIFTAVLIIGMLAAIRWLPYELNASQLIVNFISTGMLSLLFTSLIFRK
jgi:hypothetical protein